VVETLKLIIPQQDTPARRLIGFRNGVLDTKSGIFSPHHKSHWLRTLCDVDFTPPVAGETLETHARISGAGSTVRPVAVPTNAM
jgi:putative DNA primase/helicase